MEEGEVHVSTEKARAGATPHVTRYVLLASLALIVLLFAGLLLAWR